MSNPIADPLVEVPDTDARSDLVLIEATRGAATVTINRASQDNAFNAEVIGALRRLSRPWTRPMACAWCSSPAPGRSSRPARTWSGCATPPTTPRPTIAKTPCRWR